jgi:two-component sensor histidine kinase
MTGEGLHWSHLSVVLLLPFPFLALLLAFYARTLRKRLISCHAAKAELAGQAVLRAREAKGFAADLREAHAAHDRLTREFHHRVKNSLQIIQSYLALSRRQRPPPHNIHLAEAEAKVQVISAAYRLALNEGTMNPVPVRALVQDIIENAQAILCGATRRISASIEPDSLLVLDRAIPLGLAIIEAITGALGAESVMHVGIRLRPTGPDEVSVTVTIDDMFATIALPLRLMAGLQAQLEARPEPCAEDEVLHWHFRV